MARVRAGLRVCPRCSGVAVERHAELFVPETDRRVYSPWLSVTAESEAMGCRVRARFGPHPHVWTWYLFCTFATTFTVFVGLIWGYAQWVLDEKPWAFLAVPIGLVAVAVLWACSKLGQRLGHEQMNDLRMALEQMVLAEEGETGAEIGDGTKAESGDGPRVRGR